MRFPPLAGLLLATLAVQPAGLLAQSIRRCDSADGSVSYSDTACPAGTRAARSVISAAQPSAEAQKQARERAQREKDVAQSIAAQRQPLSTGSAQGYVRVEEAQRAADCAYLRAELDSNRRLRNLLTTRPYYSHDDIEQMDAREATLAADYRRVCTR